MTSDHLSFLSFLFFFLVSIRLQARAEQYSVIRRNILKALRANQFGGGSYVMWGCDRQLVIYTSDVVCLKTISVSILPGKSLNKNDLFNYAIRSSDYDH